jgi:WD40 repeat protein
VTGIDVTSDGHEILSGSRNGKLFLTHLGTAPVPLLGPTEGVEIEDCIVDSVHQLFFAGSADFRIYEFSATEYRFTSRYEGHTGPVTKVGVAGDQLYSGSRDRSIMIWDIGGQKRLGTIGLSAPVNGFCFCDSGLVFAACDSRVLGVDARAGGTAVSPPCNGDCDFNGIAAKGNELTAGDSTGVVIQWDVRNLEGPVAQWSWYDAPINEVAYNGGKLWVLTGDGTAAQIDMTEKRSQVILGTKAYAPLYSVAFWNQITIWTADDDGTINSFEL